MTFQKIAIKDLSFNPFRKISQEWFLITAGEAIESCNTMTASWGSLGHLWKKDVVTVFIRPQRHTKTIINQQSYFTLSFFGKEQKKALSFLGKVSGKDVPDKISQANLHPVKLEEGIAFEEAAMVFVVKKIYHDRIKPENFLVEGISEAIYPEQDYHEIFVAEIEAVYLKSE
ncbi:MAG: flavin reductase [Streptococcaceae bacterium]|jgi:flavin reductase (DIM6/NTAB) family NADH-FMN oxidoreductase RutF|nr:flavin reductase [Streptococcaceae bacterium]